MEKSLQTEVVVVGSGPGGATVAREVARAGKNVVILEKGPRHEVKGNWLNASRMYDKWAVFSRSKEGVIVDRAITLGGCSVVFCGNAFDPPGWLQEVTGRDLADDVSEIKREIGIKPLSEAFTAPWTATLKLRASAARMGIDLRPQSKFIDETRCRNDCDACMTGCRDHAKWTTRSWVDDSVEAGARLIMRADVKQVLRENGRATGVRAKTPGGELEVRADTVVLAAGGIGSAVLLQRSGFTDVGTHFFMDPMNVLWGMADRPVTNTTEMTFSYACEAFADDKGFLLGNVNGKNAWMSTLMRPSIGWKTLSAAGKWARMLGMFIKVADSAEGRVDASGKMTKPLNDQDRRKAAEATDLAREILIGAGANPLSIVVAESIGGHPGGTAGVGRIVDRDLRVKGTQNLFVCDASVFPRSPGRPPTLMLLALARNFSREVLAG